MPALLRRAIRPSRPAPTRSPTWARPSCAASAGRERDGFRRPPWPRDLAAPAGRRPGTRVIVPLPLLVDEYQDTNASRPISCALRHQVHGNVIAVGDDAVDSRLRGADVKNILSFPQWFPGAKTFKLLTNHRSIPGNPRGRRTPLIAQREAVRRLVCVPSGPKPCLVPAASARQKPSSSPNRSLSCAPRDRPRQYGCAVPLVRAFAAAGIRAAPSATYPHSHARRHEVLRARAYQGRGGVYPHPAETRRTTAWLRVLALQPGISATTPPAAAPGPRRLRDPPGARWRRQARLQPARARGGWELFLEIAAPPWTARRRRPTCSGRHRRRPQGISSANIRGLARPSGGRGATGRVRARGTTARTAFLPISRSTTTPSPNAMARNGDAARTTATSAWCFRPSTRQRASVGGRLRDPYGRRLCIAARRKKRRGSRKSAACSRGRDLRAEASVPDVSRHRRFADAFMLNQPSLVEGAVAAPARLRRVARGVRPRQDGGGPAPRGGEWGGTATAVPDEQPSRSGTMGAEKTVFHGDSVKKNLPPVDEPFLK